MLKKDIHWAVLGTGVIANEMAAALNKNGRKIYAVGNRTYKKAVAFAEKYDIEKVILFGSRARGDFRRTSDIDIAVTGGDFARFALDVDEETSTLLEYDIVNLDRDMQDELRESIEKEGRILYEKI